MRYHVKEKISWIREGYPVKEWGIMSRSEVSLWTCLGGQWEGIPNVTFFKFVLLLGSSLHSRLCPHWSTTL